jgi:hypothetical protein
LVLLLRLNGGASAGTPTPGEAAASSAGVSAESVRVNLAGSPTLTL